MADTHGWQIAPKNDRLKRWMILDMDGPGRGKPVLADNIRQAETARIMAAAPDLYIALANAIGVIESHVAEGALGYNSEGDGQVPGGTRSWPLRDEYLHYMRAAIAKADGPPTD